MLNYQDIIEKEKKHHFLTQFFFFAGALFFLGLLFNYCVIDIPVNDDYGYALGVVNNIVEKNSFEKTFRLLFNTPVEHRVVIFKFLALFSYKTFGAVNFAFINFIGGLSSLFIFLFFIKSIDTEYLKKNNWYLLLPVFLLIFIPLHKVNNWGITAIANTQVHLFTYASLYFLHKLKWNHFLLAILFAVLALFSMGNGLFIWLIGTLVLIIHKRYYHLLFWVILTAFLIYFYFDGLGVTNEINPPSRHPSILNKLQHHWKGIFIFPSILLGSFFKSFTENLVVLSIIGWSMLIAGLVFIIKHFKYFYKNTLLSSYLLFIMLSIAAAALSRGYSSYEAGLTLRYGMYPMIYLCLFYLMYLQINPDRIKKYFPYILACSLIFYFLRAHTNIDAMAVRKRQMVNGIREYNKGNPSKLYHPKKEKATEILQRSEELGTYKPPDL